jgi:hypothetical protein
VNLQRNLRFVGVFPVNKKLSDVLLIIKKLFKDEIMVYEKDKGGLSHAL